MKVLFAVSSESISDAIIKRYQKEYKEILSYKNVYYFNAILKEIQKDKSYDRIVISEDLEPFSNNNYDTIDKFIFEKLDNISDEAHDSQGKETSIILICTDRHTKGSSFLVKLFSIGVYNALLGNDRSMDQVCRLINQPRVKKEAKMYYKIDADDVSYDPKSEKEVSELEIQNILNHFKKIAKNKDKFADSFNNIAAQYTDEQLKIIINCLPINVKAVLEEECPKYQELMSAGGIIQRVGGQANLQTKEAEQKTGIKIDILENKLSQPKMSGPIVIPSSVKTAKSRGPVKVKTVENTVQSTSQNPEQPTKKVVKKISHKPIENDEKEVQKESSTINSLLSEIDELDDIEDTKLVNDTNPIIENKETQTAKDMLENSFEEDDSLLMSVDDKETDDFVMDVDDDTLSMLLNNDEEDDNIDDTILIDSEEQDEELFTLDDEIEDSFDDLLPNLDEDIVDDEVVLNQEEPVVEEKNETVTIKKGRGRPRKNPIPTEPKSKGKRGRPRKNPVPVEDVIVEEIEQDDEIDLILEDDEEIITPDMFLNQDDETVLTEDSLEFEEDDALDVLDDSFEILDEEGEEYTDEVEIPDLDGLDDLDDFGDLEETTDFDLDTELEDEELEMIDEEEEIDEVSLPDIDGLEDIEDYQEDGTDDLLPGLEYEEFEEDDYLISGVSSQDEEDDDSLLLDFESEDGLEENVVSSVSEDFSNNLEDDEPFLNPNNNNAQENVVESIKPQVDYSMSNLNSLLTKDKKIVTFLGTTKNGTSFLINNLAALFASVGINTAILDMTQNRNSYYIYTKNEEELRKTAYTSIEKLENGFAEGIKVDKNLTVYTALPNNGKDYRNAEPILSTLVQNHSLVLIDCDFNTDPSYFASCQEIYLVQSMDILTIQPLTSFLRDLKAKGVLESEKVRVVINKELKVRNLTTKMIIGGMSFYNDPAMSFMTELFNKDMVKACSIPFEDITYSKYLDGMVTCNVSLNGYSKNFLSKLRILGDMVYPLTSKQTYGTPNYKKNNFSTSMNNTLNQMKNKF